MGIELARYKTWLKHFASGKYAGAQVQPLQCIQEEGEVAFVPARWGHGVINLQPSIGLAVQMGSNTDVVHYVY